jgi:hypothetical protein
LPNHAEGEGEMVEKTEDERFHDSTKKLKDVLEVIEKLRARKRELKANLNKEILSDDDERRNAEELASICLTLIKMDDSRTVLYKQLQKEAPSK